MSPPDQLAGVSVALETPAAPTPGAPGILLGHGAGSDYQEVLLATIARGLATRGHLTCRFNFPYRQHGRRMPDRAPALEASMCAVAEELRSTTNPPIRALVAGGKSMGGRIASQAVAQGRLACQGLLFLSYPLHPQGKVDRLRTAHLGQIAVPMLFVSGTRDPLARLDLLEAAVADLGDRAHLHLIPDGDHSLKVLKRTRRPQEDVYEEVVDTAAKWLAAHVT